MSAKSVFLRIVCLMAILTVVHLLVTAGGVSAQSQLVPPVPKSTVPLQHPKFAVDGNGNIIEQGDRTIPPPLEGPTQPALEIPQVPKPFEGCWEGTATQPDSWQVFDGPRLAGFIPKTKVLCFKRAGDGPLTITFHDSKLDSDYASHMGHPVSNYDEQTELVSTNGKNEVSLHSVDRFDESMKILWLIPQMTTISSTSDSRCVLAEDGATLTVEGSSTTRCSGSLGCNGQVWVQDTWHTRFLRMPEP